MTDADDLKYLLDKRAAIYTTLKNILCEPQGNSYYVRLANTLRNELYAADRGIAVLRGKIDE